MPLSDAIEKLGRAIFESPFNASRLAAEAPELAEIRLAAIDAIKSKSHRVGGARVFPYNQVGIQLLGIPEAQRETLEGGFFTQFLDEEIRRALKRSSYRFPEDLQVEVSAASQLPAPGENWISIETGLRPKVEEAQPPSGEARLLIQQGTANVSEIPLNKPRVNIGRTIDVFRAEGPSRRNDLAFTEDSEINRSVSREHAHVVWEKKRGEYRIVNDRWYETGAKAVANCGLWIIRDGLSQPVHRNTRGSVLKAGDEIHLGQAVVLFVRDE